MQVFLADPQACTRSERLSHAITLLLLTGQRRGELALARWSEIDFKAQTWTIPDENAKAGRGHVVPLTDWAAREFEALKKLAKRSEWVLPANGSGEHIDPKQLTRSLAKCLKRFKEQGIEAFTLHDLCRTCRTGLSRLKVEPHIAERVLNHVQPGIVGVYDRFAYLEEKRTALERWEEHLRKLSSKSIMPLGHKCPIIRLVRGNEFIRRVQAIAKARGLPSRVDKKRGSGGHMTLYLGHRLTVVRNPKDELKTGTLHAMCKQLGIEKEEL